MFSVFCLCLGLSDDFVISLVEMETQLPVPKMRKGNCDGIRKAVTSSLSARCSTMEPSSYLPL